MSDVRLPTMAEVEVGMSHHAEGDFALSVALAGALSRITALERALGELLVVAGPATDPYSKGVLERARAVYRENVR